MQQYKSILDRREDFYDENPRHIENLSLTLDLVSGLPARDRRHYALQPILDASRNVVGHEALYRSGWADYFQGDPESASRIMIDNWLLFGFNDASPQTLTFLNCTREILLSGLLTLLPQWAVLEVLETVKPDREVLRACRKLKKLGYRISLDDFEPHENMEELVGLADFIKIDFRKSNSDERCRLLRRLRGSNARMIAEKIETEEEFQMAKWEGFQLFQGFYFREKSSFAMPRDHFDEANCLRLLERLRGNGFAVGKLADLAGNDAGIGCRLLRMANWVSGEGRPVNSIREALKLVGKSKFRKLVLLVMLAEVLSWDDLTPEALQHCHLAGLTRGGGYAPAQELDPRSASNLITMAKGVGSL